MVEQLDIFAESAIQEEDKLTPRQHRLRNWLTYHFESGRYFTIEEICNADIGYTLNTNPKTHDKCIALANDIKAINWNICERYKIIIKDNKGSCKLAESETEFNAWRDAELAKVEKKYQYLNNLKWKAARDGTVPVVNQANRALKPEETTVVEVYQK